MMKKSIFLLPLALTACWDDSAKQCQILMNDESKQSLAESYCKKAAYAGDAVAQFWYGKQLLSEGKQEQAVEFLEKSASQNYGGALLALGLFYEQQQDDEAKKQARFYFQRGCDENEIKSCERLQILNLAKAEVDAANVAKKAQVDREARLALEQAKAKAAAEEKARFAAEAALKAKEVQAEEARQKRLQEEARLAAEKEAALALKAKIGNRKFRYGLAKFQEGNLWGHINQKGEMVIPAQFAYAADFYDGLAAVKTTDGLWGYIYPDGRYAIYPRFRCVWYFSEGVAAVTEGGYGKNCQGGKWGFIDKQGRWFFDPILDLAEPFKNGVAKITYEGRTGYMNKQRQWADMP